MQYRLENLAILALAACGTLAGCDKLPNFNGSGIQPRDMADALHAVLAADRKVYANAVVNRLQDEEKIIKATEHWQDDKTLPLPAQMFRMGAETVAEEGHPFSYALLSLWPVNKQNAAKTDEEKKGLQFVADNPAKTYYGEEALGGRRYFTAIYADKAVSPSCVACHNHHADSPRNDFKEGDVMGGVVIRIPLGG